MRTKIFTWRHQEELTQKQAAEVLKLPFLVYRQLERGRLIASQREREALQAHFGTRAEEMLEPLA